MSYCDIHVLNYDTFHSWFIFDSRHCSTFAACQLTAGVLYQHCFKNNMSVSVSSGCFSQFVGSGETDR